MAVLARRIDAVIPRLSGFRFPPGEARRILRLLLRLLLREEWSEADSSDSNGRRSTAEVVACPPAAAPTEDAPNNN